ncbi:MAG: maleamate amidohydrolase [Gammaproteobacteria bacterium]|jgi:maleamate amidohydrolase
MSDAFQNATYGAREVGYGERPAVLVVDYQRGFTDSAFTMGKSDRIHAARDRTVGLLEAARNANIPVASCTVGWHTQKDIQYWKVDALHEEFYVGSEALEIDPLIYDADYDFTFLKSAPSMFFQTPIVSFLTKHRVDTAIVTGCVTSGCIRATAIDAFSYGYRTILVDDCCGDPAQDSHEANLRDIARRYADVRQRDEVMTYFDDVRGRNEG